MEDLSGKILGSDLTAVEFVQPMSELQKIITNSGIALLDSDVAQMAKALSTQIIGVAFMTATGAMPTKVLTAVAAHQPVNSLLDGMMLRFRSSDAYTTGSPTLNVDTLGAKAIKREDGSSLRSGDINASCDAVVRYDTSAGGRFLLTNPQAKLNLSMSDRNGLRQVFVTVPRQRLESGSIRNASDTADLLLSSNFDKDFTVTWVAGTGNGGVPSGIVPITGGIWYGLFLANTPDGGEELFLDDNVAGTNFWADANAIAAGYTDNTLYRRVGRVYHLAGPGGMNEYHVDVDDPSQYTWDIDVLEHAFLTVTAASPRTAVSIGASPPGHRSRLNLAAERNGGGVLTQIVITEGRQTDTATAVNFTMNALGVDETVNIRGEWLVDSSGDIYIEHDAASDIELYVMCNGWIDKALAP